MTNLISFLKQQPKRDIVLIQGLGFVGSVMSLVCSNAINRDYTVLGIELETDRGKKIIDDLNNGVFPLLAQDPKIDQFFKSTLEKGNFFATYDTEAYKYASIIIVDINLDVKKNNDNSGVLKGYTVNLDGFKSAIKTIGDNCKEDALILIETTVPPGTCEEIIKPIIYKCLIKRDLSTDKIKIGHSYERVMPGPDYINSIQNFYRVYSGIDDKSADAVESFLKTIIFTKEYPLTRLDNTNSTEIAKVLENSYRAMNISLIVEWSRYAEEAKVNLYEIIDAIRLRPTHANLMYPGIGVGGYCLTKDALLASWSRQNLLGKSEPLLQSEIAININDQMPKYAFRFLKKEYRSLANCNVLLLGVSYRGEVGDTRNTPVANLHDYLIKDGAFVTCHDPFVENWVQKSISINTDLSKLLTNNIDIIIISTGHSIYKNQNTIDMILKLRPLFIFDTIGFLSNEQISTLQNVHTVKVLGRGDL
mgnify:CR=1 FL=1